MPAFNRYFKNLARYFPPSGTEYLAPREVFNDISLTAELFRYTFANDVRLFYERRFTDNVAAGDTAVDLSEPGAGFVFLPVLLNVKHNSAATRRIRLRLLATTTALDPWGRWDTTSRDIATLRAGADTFTLLPALPVTQGSSLSVLFEGMVLNDDIEVNHWALNVPGELMTMDLWRTVMGNFVHNFPI